MKKTMNNSASFCFSRAEYEKIVWNILTRLPLYRALQAASYLRCCKSFHFQASSDSSQVKGKVPSETTEGMDSQPPAWLKVGEEGDKDSGEPRKGETPNPARDRAIPVRTTDPKAGAGTNGINLSTASR